MDSLETLRARIDSYQDLRTIVGTMKALSAVNIRQYEQAAESVRDYQLSVEMALQALFRDMPDTRPADRPRAPYLGALVFGSDHGLCGRFNEDLAAYVAERLSASPAAPEPRRVLAIGERAATRLDQQGLTVTRVHPSPAAAERITATLQDLLLRIHDWTEHADVGYVYVFYNRRVVRSGYRPTGVQLLPLGSRRFRRLTAKRWPGRGRPCVRGDPPRMLRRVLRQYLFVSLFRAAAESLASEHSSRLAAMQNADRNLSDQLETLSARYRRARQDSITAELLDVVSGFEAVTPSGD